MADRPGGSELRAARLHERAVQQYNRGTPARSLVTLRRALALLDTDTDTDTHAQPHTNAEPMAAARAALVARIWISIALSESELRSVEDGFAALETAARFTALADDPSVRVLLHCQRGLIELRGGSATRALEQLDAAARLIEHAEPRQQASILLNRGTVAMMEGRLPAARRDFQRAVEIERAAGLPVELFKTLHNGAYVEFLAGDLPRALHLMDEAAQVDADVSRGVWLLDRARVLTEAGLTREADESLGRAVEILRRERMAQDLAETRLERARCALVTGDTATARRFAAQARAGFRRRGNDRWRRAAELVLLSADLAAGRPGRRLAAEAGRLRAECDAAGLRFPARTAALLAAEATLATGDAASAAQTLDGLEPASPRDPITSRLHDHYVRAAVAVARGDVGGARRRIRRGLDQLTAHQASFGSIDLRTAAAVHGRRLAELDVRLALETGRPAAVFAAAERARAVASRLPTVRPPADDVAAELLAELRQVIETLRAVEQDRGASEPLLARRFELERRIVARTWSVAGSGAAAPAAELDEVRERLARRGRHMITYIHVGAELSAVSVGARTRVHRLGPAGPVLELVRRGRADLDVLAHDHLPPAIRTAVRASLERTLAELDRHLVAPLSADAEGRPLAVISTGLLGQLPWASLPSLRGRSLIVAPSATKWLAGTRERESGECRVTAVAGPGLERSAAEASTVAASWSGARVLDGPRASRAEVTAAFAATDVLHVAAHGTHQSQNALFSSLRMADGPLFAHELDLLGVAPEHVVLSACEVGLATVRPGDEALGLASVLLHLGTRSVIAGVARVSDRLAEAVMLAYHARLRRGVDSAQALADALVEVDSDVMAPFVAFGASWSAKPSDPVRSPARTGDLAG